MELRGLSPAERRELARALRAGEPVRLTLDGPAPPDARLDELVPLCIEARARDRRLQRILDPLLAPTAGPPDPRQVTVLIPCSRAVPLGIAALKAQDLRVRVIVLSNGEAGPMRAPGAEVVRVSWEGHGRTRQRAVEELVQDPYVLFTVDDAIPLGGGFLRVMVEALEEGGFDAVMARQLPWPDTDAVTRERLRQWTPSGSQVIPWPRLDNVAALYRREVLLRDPFPDVPIAEDAWWGRGHRVGYVPGAAVLHSHPRAPRALFRRTRDIHAQLAQMGEPATVPNLATLLSALPGVVRPSLVGQRGEWRNQLAELLGQWRGAARGRKLP